MKEYRAKVLSVILFGFGIPCWAAAAGSTRNVPTTTLYGVVMMDSFWGPPNFGLEPKEDERITVPLLIIMMGRGNSYRGVGRHPKDGEKIQIHNLERPEAQRVAGRCVAVTGFTMNAVFPSDNTPRTIFADSVTISDKCE